MALRRSVRGRTRPQDTLDDGTATDTTATNVPSGSEVAAALPPAPATAAPATVRQYLSLCRDYGAAPNAGVLTTLRFALPTLRPSGAFHDLDMLPLVDLLLLAPGAAHIRALDLTQASRDGPLFGRCGIGSHGAVALAALLRGDAASAGAGGQRQRQRGAGEGQGKGEEKVARGGCRLESLELSGNAIGAFGGVALAEALGSRGGASSLRKLGLRKCFIDERGGLAMAERVLAPGSGSALEDIDLSVNNLGMRALAACEAALAARAGEASRVAAAAAATAAATASAQRRPLPPPPLPPPPPPPPPMKANLEGNLVFAEVMNSVTHGLGIVLAIVGTVFMGLRAAEMGSWRHRLAATVYSTALIILFTASCLYHSLFALRGAHNVFRVLDHSAIYILIAGSYTPFLLIPFGGADGGAASEFYSVWLLGFLWACCVAGVLLTAFYHGRLKAQIGLALFLGMGWTAGLCLNDLRAALLPGGVRWLLGGGLTYTLGVPLFLRNRELDHAIWHLFVLAGAAAHWWAIYHYVMPLPINDAV